MGKKTQNATQLPVAVYGSSSFGVHHKISSERSYNIFQSDDFMIGFPGYKKVLELLPAGEGRGIFRSIRGNFLLVVVNALVYRLNAVLAPTLIGPLGTNSGEVFIDENLADQICIVDGVNAYIYNHSLPPNLTVQALNPALVPNYVDYHNTFFLFGNGSRGPTTFNWYVYEFASPTTISEVSAQTIQTKPDYPIAVVRIPGQGSNVLVFGTAVCEIQTQVGGLQNYRTNKTISIDYGCLSVNTIDSADQYVAWLAVNEFNAPVIMVYSGAGAVQISSDGISYELSKIVHPEDSTASFIRVDGHLMYQLTFYNPDDNVTYLYDFTEQKFYNLTDQNLDYHPARKYAYFNQKMYFASLRNASIYQISTDLDSINENQPGESDPAFIHDMQRLRITDTVRAEDNDRFIANRLSFTIEQGTDPDFEQADLGLQYRLFAEDGVTPLISEFGVPLYAEDWPGVIPYQPRVDLTISLDSGITWSNTVAYYLNPLGFRRNLINWNQLGAANEMTFKIRFWGLGKFIATKGIVEVRA